VSPQLAALLQSGAAREPVRYTGELQPDPAYFDGRLPHAVGDHHIQVFRASRSKAVGGSGFTYNHQPFLVWWSGRFYLQFLGAPRNEHDVPTFTFVCSSADGYSWSPPQTVFPDYRLPAFKINDLAYPAGRSAVMHQRMGFYVAPNSRLLTLGFYGICPDPQHSPNAGNGVGRVVREIREGGTLGEIYFIRYNRQAGFNEGNTAYPFFATSPDPDFRAACEALLADKLATLQWWEEDRGRDGFFPIDPSAVPDAPKFDARMVTSAGAGKAFTWFTRPNGVVVGLWKNQYSALSPDRGASWTPIVRNRSLRTTGAKTWGQRTSDGRFVIVYNHSATQRNRFPISALVGDNGEEFSTLLCLGGEVPPRRYVGSHKDRGMQYFRGISEGSAQPPDGDLWIAYSMNKEDIWVLRAKVPLTSIAATPPQADELAGARSMAELMQWNFYLPQWAAARIAIDVTTGRRLLEMRDEEPWDYAQAERMFPATRKMRVRFRVQGRELASRGSFEVEVQSQRHERPIRLRFNADGLSCDGGPIRPAVPFAFARWYACLVECDCESGCYTLQVDGATVHARVPFAEPAALLERIVFRTGPWRGLVPAHLVKGSAANVDGEDVGEDTKAAPTVFWVDELSTEAMGDAQ
jgi:hypothetical protein